MPSIVITGASQGIGAATAGRFAREQGWQIALLSRNREKMRAVAAQCETSGAETMVIPCDVTKVADVDEAAGRVVKAWGTPDVLVNNAGQFVPGGLLDMSPDDFRYQIDVNLMSAYHMTRAILPGMLDADTGHIFFMASVASIRSYPGGAAYGTAKHGLLGLARATREETMQSRVRVTSVIPGATWTPSWEGVDVPRERFMNASDIAEVIWNAYALPAGAVVEEIVVRPQQGDL